MKYAYTDQNHFRFGYLPDSCFLPRSSSRQEFFFQYGRARREIKSWREANKLAALKIRENFQLPLWILSSGGTDSEACLLSFLEAGVPFRIASLRMKNGLNSHDLEHALRFCRERNLKMEIFDLDVEQFLTSETIFAITDPIQCVSPILACHLWLADQLDGVPIIAQGECYLRKAVPEGYVPGVSPYPPSDWSLIESERLCSLYLHFILKDRPAVPGFFQYLPEQIDSFLRFNPILSNLVQNKIPGKLGTRSSKNEMVRFFYPEIRERPKYTGFEQIEELHDQVRSQLAARYPHSDQNAEIKYETLVEQVRPI